jgi:hypothetical protein
MWKGYSPDVRRGSGKKQGREMKTIVTELGTPTYFSRATMHQEHNIAWNTLASNFEFIQENPHYTPRTTGIFFRDLPEQTKQLRYFVQSFSGTIRTFAQTERAKYPTSFPAQSSGQIFSDDLRDKYPDFLNKRVQCIEYWIATAKSQNWCYHSGNGELADVVKILIHENQLSTLLMLAQHPDIPLHGLYSIGWGHHFGFSRVAESSLRAYIFFNLSAAMGILDNEKYGKVDKYPRFVKLLCDPMDYDGQQVVHRSFFDPWKSEPSPAVHHDLPRLRQYLKDLFVLLYRFDVVMKECNLDPEWGSEIQSSLGAIVGQYSKRTRTV